MALPLWVWNSETSGCTKWVGISAVSYTHLDVYKRQQIISASASLIPFLEHNDANRALMGTNMQRQAVPLLVSKPPLIGTGMEYKVAQDSGATVVSRNSGVVKQVDSVFIEIENDDGDIDLYELEKFQRSNQSTCKMCIRDRTYAAPLFARVRLINRETNEIKEQDVYMGEIPLMTDKGTFVVNGAERVVVCLLYTSRCV